MEVNGNGDYSLCSIINANKVLETRYLTMGALLSRLHFVYELFDNIFSKVFLIAWGLAYVIILIDNNKI